MYYPRPGSDECVTWISDSDILSESYLLQAGHKMRWTSSTTRRLNLIGGTAREKEEDL